MSELIIIEHPEEFRSAERRLLAARVLGIAASGSNTVTEYGCTARQLRSATEEALTFDDAMADRLTEFYRRCRSAAPEDRPNYNCHLLAWYLIGKVTELREYSMYKSAGGFPRNPVDLESGKIYSILTAGGVGIHTMVGIDRPDHSLSVIGTNQPLVIAENTALARRYDGESILEVTPVSAR